MQPGINQKIYGVPEYLSALQLALLKEAATLFRRRYYLDSSHGRFILYATGDIDENDANALRDALKNSKGPDSFKTLFVHAPGGKEGSIEILPLEMTFMEINNRIGIDAARFKPRATAPAA